MKTILVVFMANIVFFHLTSLGQEKISGAFGMTIGEAFDPATAIGESELTDGTPLYRFTPEIEFRSFTRYFVMITPKTKKIYAIWATGPFKNTETAKKEQALVMEILRQKYGELKEPGLFDAMGDVLMIDHGDRYIVTKISGFTDITFDIRYYDRELKELAEKERLELEAAKVDSSGL